MKNLVRPPVIENIPKTNPFDSQTRFWKKQYWLSFFKTMDPKQWKGPVKKMLDYYKTILGTTPQGRPCFKKGTVLYHGSTSPELMIFQKKSITFFGLDADISLWYILEEIYMKNDPRRNITTHLQGYLYEFVLTRDLPITKIIDKININPKDQKSGCLQPKAVCLHPQITFHGSSIDTHMRDIVPLFDLCSEATFVAADFKDYLQLKNIYPVDTYQLHKHAADPSYDPTRSIVPRQPFPPEEIPPDVLEPAFYKTRICKEFSVMIKCTQTSFCTICVVSVCGHQKFFIYNV